MTETSDTATSGATHAKPRRKRPEWVSIVIEFFTMSRSTLVLLIAFVLVAALYSFVRQDPVVAFNSPPRPDPTQSETTETGTSGTGTTGTDESRPTGQTTQPTSVTDDQDPTGTDTSPTISTGPQRQFDQGDGTAGQQTPQSATGTQQTQQAPQGQQPQAPQQPAQTQVPTQ